MKKTIGIIILSFCLGTFCTIWFITPNNNTDILKQDTVKEQIEKSKDHNDPFRDIDNYEKYIGY